MSSRAFVRLAGGFTVIGSLIACSSDGAGPASGGGGSGSSGGSSTAAGSGGVPSAGTGGAVATGGGGTGALTAGSGGSAGAGAGGGGAAGSAGASGSGGATAVACPADKSFCAGFEDTALPEGAVYEHQSGPGEWTRDFQIDTTVFKSGKSSVKVVNPGSGQLQMLRVPAPPGGKFWARFYIRQAGADIGDLKHNVFAGASWATDANTKMIEFAEDVGVAINANDVVRWPMGFGRIEGTPMPFTLKKDEWHCIELSFDGVARVQQLYVEGELKIDATNFPEMIPMPLAYFRFGFQALNGPKREIWYDDVAVGPTRPGCLPK